MQSTLNIRAMLLTADAIKFFGSAAALASALGITRSAVSQWDEHVPKLREFELRALMDMPAARQPAEEAAME